MRLLYLYLDFTQNGKTPDGYRGHKQCELNFSTEYIYTMERASAIRTRFCLKRTARKENDRVELGFWGDERIYNISAIVGENGTGKTTLMHAAIRALTALYFRIPQSLPFHFICLMQDSGGKIYLIYSQREAKINTPDFECSQISYSTGIVSPYFLRKTKLITFSNTMSMSDLEQCRILHEDSEDGGIGVCGTLYSNPLYDCSLVANMMLAQEVSNTNSNKRPLEDQLYTYFTFESYQQARYLFDRNQRNILLQMRKDGYPVPFPRELTLGIHPVVERLKKVEEEIAEGSLTDGFFGWYCQYSIFSEQANDTYLLLAELSLNCVVNFLRMASRLFGHDSIGLVALPEAFTEPQDYIRTMDFVAANQSDWRLQTYYTSCRTYIEFLWNNAEHIRTYWTYYKNNYVCHIPLGEQLDPILQELMIRFVDLNRAISGSDYFVTYQWGFSSGENILLRIFTKLRYLLSGTCYDEESAEFITAESAQNAMLAERKDHIQNSLSMEETWDCDSVILFLDEADLSLHPEWQRMFVATLAEFLPRLYQNPYYPGADSGCQDIQIILTTHSPLMLGDFPSASVLYLKKGNDGCITVESNSALQPFGQNLYTLLKDGFYLQNGTIGALAQKKIKRVLEDIQKIKPPAHDLPMDYTEQELDKWEYRLEMHRQKTVRYLPEGIMRSKLEEEIAAALAMIHQRRTPEQKEQIKQELRADIARLQRQLDMLEHEGETSR